MSYTAPPRCPDELLAADLPDWAVRVWLAVRSVQGGNGEAWAYYDVYAARSGKSEAMVSKAVSLLRREGWLEVVEPASRGNAPRLRCLWKRSEPHSDLLGEKGRNPVPTKGEKVGTLFRKGRNPVPKRSECGSDLYNKEESEQEPGQEPAWRARANRAGEGVTEGPTLETVLAVAKTSGVSVDLATRFFHHYDAEGWTVNGRPIRRWQSKLMQWKTTEPKYATPERASTGGGTVSDLTKHAL